MLEIKKYSPKSHKIKALIYGASWSWKTTFWGTAENAIFASSEWGLLSIADKQPEYQNITTVEQLEELKDFLAKWEHHYKTLIIDSLSDISELIKKSIEDKTGHSMAKEMWGELSDKIKWILASIKKLDMHILIITQEKYEKDWEWIKKIVPSLSWKLAFDICYLMDIVWYIGIDDKWKRNIFTWWDKKNLTKDRTSRIGNGVWLDFQKWINLVEDISCKEEEVIYTVMTPVEKELIRKTANSENYKKALKECKTVDELWITYKWIDKKEITTIHINEINKLTGELKETLTIK